MNKFICSIKAFVKVSDDSDAINLKKENSYPVVYENKLHYVYTIHGSDEIEIIQKNTVLPIDEFMEIISRKEAQAEIRKNRYSYRYYHVIVSKTEMKKFDEFCNNFYLEEVYEDTLKRLIFQVEKELENNGDLISRADETVEYWEKRKSNLLKAREEKSSRLDTLKNELENYLDKKERAND